MNKQLLVLLSAGALGISASEAAISPINSAVLTAPVDNQVGFVSFTVGSTIYSDLTIAAFTSGINTGVTTARYWDGGSGSTTGRPSSHLAGLNDAYITTGIFGSGFSGTAAQVDFGLTLDTGDTRLIYITEHIGNDNGIVINPLVGGSVDTSWSLTLNASDYGTVTTTFNWENEPNQIAGTTFTIADFSGGAGTLTNVDGIQITHLGTLDPGQVGIAAVPEPSTIALLLGLGALCMVYLRRKNI
jgi:hypothetical protein